jgi:hypothetical protein
MSVDATTPTLISELPARIVEIAEAVNDLAAQNNYSVYGEYAIGPGVCHPEGAETAIEVMALAVTGSSTLSSIEGANDGAIKIVVVDSGSITVTYGAGTMILAGAVDLSLTAGDCIAFVNRGGDPGNGTDGSWRELFRILF